MITIWEQPILASVEDIIRTLQTELRADNSELLRDIKNTHRNIMVTCPFHSGGTERHPSCGITLQDKRVLNRIIPAGTANCFTCGYTSDLPNFVSNVLGKQDRGLLGYKWVTSRFASISVESREVVKLDMSRNAPDVVQESKEISDEELAQYRFIHPYMKLRKLTDRVIEYFDVGYDKKTNSLTFPVKDENGRVLFLQRRCIDKKQFMNDEFEKGRIIYGYYEVLNNLSWIKEIYVCESIIDALTLWGHRIPAIAILGSTLTDYQANLLIKLPVRRYIVATDNPLLDEAGQKAAIKFAEKVGKAKLINYLKYPEGLKDVNEMTDEQITNRELVSYPYFLSSTN